MNAATATASPDDIRRVLRAIHGGETFAWVGQFNFEDDDALRAEKNATSGALIECLHLHYVRINGWFGDPGAFTLTPKGLRLAGATASPDRANVVARGAKRATPRRRAATPRPTGQVVSTSLEQAEALTSGLIGLGATTPNVRAFVAGLGDRVAKEPLQVLLKEGIATLFA